MLKVGILGAGRVALRHVQGWQAAGATITAVCGHHQGSAEKWMQKHGIEAKPFYSYHNLGPEWQEEMVRDFLAEDFDVVSITSPPHSHVQHLRESMQAGKHVVVEKPVYCDLHDLWEHDRNRHGWQKSHLDRQHTGVCFVNRWFSAVRNARKRVEELGSIVSVQATYLNALTHEKPVSRRDKTQRGSMSTLLSSGCHILDLAQWFIDSLIVEVQCKSPLDWSSNPARVQMVQRTSELLVRFRSGAVGTISVSDECFHPFTFRLLVRGENGSIEITETYARIYSRTGSREWETIEGTVPHSGAIEHLPYEAMIAHFAQSITEDKATECDISNQYALRAHQACFAAQEAAVGNDPAFVFRYF